MPPYENYPVGLYAYHDFSDNDEEGIGLPLTGVAIEANVHDFIAEVKLSQIYKNTESVAVEAIYHFPVDESASVCSFLAEYDDGTVVKGIIEEKKKARKDYDEAISSGRRANLLEAVRRDVFTLNVGNMPPNGNVKISITYVTSLKARDNAAAFILPTYVAPRYSPPNGELNASEMEALQGQTSFIDLSGLDIKVNFRCLSNIESITSPTHPNEPSYSCDLDGKMGQVALRNISMNRDLVLLVQEEQTHQPRACVGKTEDGKMAGLVSIFPKLEFKDEPCEIIFIIDRSGSMSFGGYYREKTQIEQARDALLLFLRALPPSCSFNIVGFGSYFKSLFDQPMPYSDETLEQASRYVEGMTANMGGTEIKAPLEHVLKREIPPHMQRQVFVLTDGQVTNDKEVFNEIQKHCAGEKNKERRCRVFSLGVGSGVSRHLVEGMARAGGGTAVFVEEGDLSSLRAKVTKQLKQALQPSLDKVSIHWTFPPNAERKDHVDRVDHGLSASEKNLLNYSSPSVEKESSEYRLFPTKTPPVFNKERLLSFALFDTDAKDLPESVTIECESPDGPLEVTVKVSDSDVFYGKAIHRMAARAAISEYEESRKGYGYKYDGLVSRAEALRLALDYNLVSEQTSFVAIEELETGITNRLVSRDMLEHVQPPISPVFCAGHTSVTCIPSIGLCSATLQANIDNVLQRGEKLECLAHKSCMLSEQANVFKKQSKRMNRSFINFGAVGRSFRRLADWSRGSTVPQVSAAKSEQLPSPPPPAAKEWKTEEHRMNAAATSPPAPAAEKSASDKMLQLCLLQKANGSFHLNDALARALDLRMEIVKQMASKSFVGETIATPLNQDVFATILAIAALHVLFCKQRDEWELQEKKALDWLASCDIDETDVTRHIGRLEEELKMKDV